jgi:hypothetical protein
MLNFFWLNNNLLERNGDFFVIRILCEINAHSLHTVSGKDRDEAWVLLFQLVSNELERFPHGVFDHFLFGFFGFFKPFVKVLKQLGHEILALILHLLLGSCNSIFLDIDRGNKKIDHVAEIN